MARAILKPSPPSPCGWNFYALNVLALFALALLLLLLRMMMLLRSVPSTYWVAAVLLMLLPIASNTLQSLARIYMDVFLPSSLSPGGRGGAAFKARSVAVRL